MSEWRCTVSLLPADMLMGARSWFLETASSRDGERFWLFVAYFMSPDQMGRFSTVWRYLFIALFVACSARVGAEPITGRVVAVSDGDTVTVLDSDRNSHKIRLMGIDAPEKAQAYGQKSKQHLSSLIYGRDVLVEWHKRDRYGRIVGKIFVSTAECQTCDKTVDAGLEQIRSGMAWWYRQYASDQAPEDRRQYEVAETEARQGRVGLWRDTDPVPPWDFRHKKRTSIR